MQPAGAGARVMIAHDVRGYADSIAAFIGAGGYGTQTAYDGRNVAFLAESWRPHAAIIKLDLASISGYDVARQLRRAYGKVMWLVGSSESNTANQEANATAAGFDAVVQRPVDLAEFLLALGRTGVPLVLKSMAASAKCLRLLIASAQTHLAGAGRTKNREQRRRALDFATRTYESVTRILEDAVMAPFEQQVLTAEMGSLAKKLKQAGVSVPPARGLTRESDAE